MLKPWPLLQINGLSFLSVASDNSITLAAYHPRDCTTWRWAVAIRKRYEGERGSRAEHRLGQWHDYYLLPFGRVLIVSQQDYGYLIHPKI